MQQIATCPWSGALLKAFVIHSRRRMMYGGGVARAATLWAMAAVATCTTGALARSPDAGGRAAIVADLLASLDREPQDNTPLQRDREAALQKLDRLGAHPVDGVDGVERSKGVPYRGRVLGPGYQRGWLDAGAETKLEQQFMAGQRATIAVAGAPTAPLTLTVVEPGERPVCQDAARACRWLPLYTQRYAITVRNAGAARVRYYLVLD